MTGPRRRCLVGCLLLGALSFGSAARARAEDPPLPPPKGETPPAGPSGSAEAKSPSDLAKEATDEEAKALVAAIDSATKKGTTSDLVHALAPWKGLRHPQVVKPLTKLLTVRDGNVALAAAAALEAQKPKGDDAKAVAKEVDRALEEIWKAAFQGGAKDPRVTVKAAAGKVHAAWGVALDARQADDLKALWVSEVKDLDAKRAAALTSIVEYVAVAKDKRFSRLLAERLDAPKLPTGSEIDNPENPPSEYWQERYLAWNEMVWPVRRALSALTGQDLPTTAAAKKWFAENEATYGFRW